MHATPASGPGNQQPQQPGAPGAATAAGGGDRAGHLLDFTSHTGGLHAGVVANHLVRPGATGLVTTQARTVGRVAVLPRGCKQAGQLHAGLDADGGLVDHQSHGITGKAAGGIEVADGRERARTGHTTRIL